MLKFDEKELKVKLADWVINAHLPAVLGMKEEDKDAIKEAFESLVEKGILLKDGQRRGLKFKYNPTVSETGNVSEESDDVSEELPNESVGSAVDVDIAHHDLHTYIKERDSIKASIQTCSHTLDDLIQWVLDSKPDRDPSITSTTLALKKMSNGSIVMRVYAGVVILVEEEFNTIDAFKKAMKKRSKPKGDA